MRRLCDYYKKYLPGSLLVYRKLYWTFLSTDENARAERQQCQNQIFIITGCQLVGFQLLFPTTTVQICVWILPTQGTNFSENVFMNVTRWNYGKNYKLLPDTFKKEIKLFLFIVKRHKFIPSEIIHFIIEYILS